MLKVEFLPFSNDMCLCLPFVCRASHLTCDVAFPVGLDNHAILRELLLNEDDFLRPSHNKVPSRIQRALVQPSQLSWCLSCQNAVAAAQHYGHSANGKPLADDTLVATRVLNVNRDG